MPIDIAESSKDHNNRESGLQADVQNRLRQRAVKGNDGNDKLHGGDGKDRLKGGGGADTLKGNDGSDTLYGGKGKDVLKGGGGNDQFWADAGNDQFVGGGGTDTAAYSGNIGRYFIIRAGGNIKVIDKNGNLGTDILHGIEKLKFGGKVYTVNNALKAGGASKKAAAEDDVAGGIDVSDFLLETTFGIDDLLA